MTISIHGKSARAISRWNLLLPFLFHSNEIWSARFKSTPRPEFGFPGLGPGDRWCLCALRWKVALEAGVAPPVVLAATHEAALGYVSMDVLNQHAVDGLNRTHESDPNQ
jgi:uncharacterized protein (DUF2237 family)